MYKDRLVDSCTKMPRIPVRMITNPAQAWATAQQLQKCAKVVGVDCEGVALGRFGQLCTLQLFVISPASITNPSKLSAPKTSSETALQQPCSYLVDALGGQEVMRAFVGLFADKSVIKVLHDSREDAAALRNQFGFEKMHSVFDTQVAHSLLKPDDLHAGFQDALELYSREGERDKIESRTSTDSEPNYLREVKEKMSNDDHLWRRRPLTTELIRYAMHGCHRLRDLFYRQLECAASRSPDDKSFALDEEATRKDFNAKNEDHTVFDHDEQMKSLNINCGHLFRGDVDEKVNQKRERTALSRAEFVDAVIRRSEHHIHYGGMNLEFAKAADAAKIGTHLWGLCCAVTSRGMYFKLNLGRTGICCTPSALGRFRDVRVGDAVRCTVAGVSIGGNFLYLDRYDPDWHYYDRRERPVDTESGQTCFFGRERRHSPSILSPDLDIDPLLMREAEDDDQRNEMAMSINSLAE
ncbi:unnamed protein product [Amoebophrya sp. A25]|nr:unnamed protein product [Amoebophrya sp. A25]|eukprot:GSA25T00001817001.1